MSEPTSDDINEMDPKRDQRRELRSYIWGFLSAILLTLVPFALVYWDAASRLVLLVVIGVLALRQMAVHFRFFLHIGLDQNREDLWLILFSALLLFIMVAGTLWIMASLTARMSMPSMPM